MKNNASVVYAFTLIVGDFLALLAAFIIAYVLRVSLDSRPLLNQIAAFDYLRMWLVLTPIWIVVFGFLGLYRKSSYDYRWREIGGLFVGSVIGIMVVITYDFLAKTDVFPARLIPVYGLGIGFLFLMLERTLLRAGRMAMWRWGTGINNVMVIGDGKVVKNLVKYMNHPARTGYKVVAVCSSQPIDAFKGKYFESFDIALQKIAKLNIHTVLFAGLSSDSKKADIALAAAQANHAAFKYVPAHEGMLSNKIDVELFQGLPVVSVSQTSLTGWARIAKRLFDIIVSFLAIIALSPFYLLIAIVVKISDLGPIIFKQQRLSRFNTPINIYKFRTHKKTYSGLSPEEAFVKMGKPNLAQKYRANGDYIKHDPRVTTIGRFLRKTSLDELPQIFNILKGNISWVGPRALVPSELDNYVFKNIILSVKSGLTGLAQISGRRDISFEERRSIDLYYVENWSFWLDIKILFRTVINVITGNGAK
jgi:exopolysaccharide biosynthesis polyprenyl glycosylphosphotransferase